MTLHQDTTVAVVAARPETILEDYARLLELAGVVPPVDATGAAAWSLVPTIPSGPAVPAAACPPWQIEGVVRALLAAGHREADIVLAAPGSDDGHQLTVKAWRRVLAACDIDDTPVAPRDLPAASSRLLLANLRTHRRLGLLGTVAAWAGAEVAGLGSVDLQRVSGDLEKAWRRAAACIGGAVIDATIAGDGARGEAMVPVAAHLLLAGRDPLAVDAVACRLAGLDPWAVPLLAPLAAADLGCIDLSAITLVGDTLRLPTSLNLVAARRFRGHRSSVGPRWWRRWNAAFAERWPRPLARRHARRRYENQAWGRLHLEYDRRDVIGGKESGS